MSAIFDVQKSIYQRLINHTPLMDKVRGVFDYVKEEQPMPYIVLGEIVSTPYKTKVSKGEEIVQTVHIFSEAEGKKEVASIVNSIEDAMKEEITITGYETYFNEVGSIEIYNDQGMFIHGIIQVRFKILEV